MSLANKGIYRFDEFQLNLDLRVLVRAGQRVPLGPKAYEVLTCLVIHAGQAVSKADLLKHAWPESYVEEGTLTQHIFSLRKALGNRADCVVTVPGYGYRLAAEVRHELPDENREWSSSSHGDVLRELRERTHVVFEEPMQPARAAAKPAVHWKWIAAVAAVVLVGAGVAGWMHSRRAAPRDYVGVVVADFVNLTGDSTFDYTLKRALEIDLGQSPYMGVMSDMEGVATLGLMGMKPDVAVTPRIGQEICQRTNREVLLTGTIASVGDRYLLTLEATDCHTGKQLMAAKATATSKGKVLDALDAIAEKGRSKLGESAQSLKNFEVPLADGATPSLDALKAYSMGVYLLDQGKIGKEAAPFFLKAVEIDPNFAQAYGELAAAYYNMGESQLAGFYTQKLCALNAHVGERTRLAIESHCGKDIFAQIKVFQMWADEYPHDWVPWLDMANLYNEAAQPENGIPPARRALQESGGNEISYDVLIRSYMNAQRFAEAKAAEADAVKSGKDSSTTHRWMYTIAVFENDAGDLFHETQWFESRKGDLRFYIAAEAAAMQGRYRLAEELFGKELLEDRQQQETDLADSVLIDKASMERDMGKPEAARASLAQVSQQVHVDAGLAVEHALESDIAFADMFLALQKDPARAVLDVSELPHALLPQLNAAEAMHRNKPLEAIADLENVWPDYSSYTLRGKAYLMSGQAKQAEIQYRALLAKPSLILSVEYPLAHLGLARAYALDGDSAGSRREYQTFLSLWNDADLDVPVLAEAKAELSRLH